MNCNYTLSRALAPQQEELSRIMTQTQHNQKKKKKKKVCLP